MGCCASKPEKDFLELTQWCPPPRKVEYKDVNFDSFTLTWHPPTGKVDKYIIEKLQLGEDSNFESVIDVDGELTHTRVNGLKEESKYLIRICSEHNGFSDWVVLSNPVITPRNIPLPNQPVNLRATETGENYIVLVWEQGDDNQYEVVSASLPAVKYVIEGKRINDHSYKLYDNAISGNSLRYKATGLLPETAYEFRVAEQNARGASDWCVLEEFVTTASPPPPEAAPSAPSVYGGKKSIVVALYDYVSREPGDLAFSQGDKMEIIQDSNSSADWLMGVHQETKERGFIPANYVVEDDNSLESQPWFFIADRKTAVSHLTEPDNGKGTFMIRCKVDNNNTSYALSVRNKAPGPVEDKDIKHYKIQVMGDNAKFYINKSTQFTCIEDLIEHYKNNSGVCCLLTTPCPKSPEVLAFKDIEVNRDTIALGRKLGAGGFGDVFEASLQDGTKVAVKQLKPGKMTPKAFLEEAKIMHKLQHDRLVKLLGVCSLNEPIFIITELMENGALKSYLTDDKDNKIMLNDMIEMAYQIAHGMSYLEEKRYIHRDLRSANVLVGEGNICKVADFGLARVTYPDDDDIYTAGEDTKYPIKWTAPEAATLKEFSIKSDVWSYGILLYEILTKGRMPYPGIPNWEVITRLENGYRMPQPAIQDYMLPSDPNDKQDTMGTWNAIYVIMNECWRDEAAKRPTFKDLHSQVYTLIGHRYNEEDSDQP